MRLSQFTILRPPFETTQEKALDWILEAHTRAESAKKLPEDELALFRQTLRENLWRVGCKPDRIAKRGHILPDFLHLDWSKMEIYRLNESPQGKDLSHRAKFYSKHVTEVFEQFYPESALAPDDLIHVTCTGYTSPSGAQKIVSRRNWGQKTTVTHAYHMGCYGAIAALRIARGFVLQAPEKRTDIVHTEVCCLHSNPSHHQLDQLVSQSLFADGFIKYSASEQGTGNHLKVIQILEEIIPNSTAAMTWDVMEWGFQMSLAKEIPVFIKRHLAAYLERLLQTFSTPLESCLFAIHPGGPKILLYIQELLHLSDAQMAYSFEILKNCGNMSSATLPHIWHMICQDTQIKTGTPIVSLAFGPGLTIAGALMEKVCGS